MTLLRSLAIVPFGLSLLAPAAHAQDAVATADTGFSQTLELGFVTNYMFRGISNSNNDRAIQPGYTANWATDGGAVWSLDAWASTLDQSSSLDTELDLWGGVTWSNGYGDFGAAVTGYFYPGAPNAGDSAFVEGQLTYGHSLGPVYVSGEYDYSPEYYGIGGDAHYISIGLTSNDGVLPVGLVLSGHVGHQYFEDNAAFGTPDYSEGGIRLERSFSWLDDVVGLKAGLEYTDTDMSTTDCFGGLDICGDTFLFTLVASANPK